MQNPNQPTHSLPKIGGPATVALLNINITTLKQALKLSDKELLAIHGIGPKAVRLLHDAAREQGLEK